jgi:hypothetical protein
MVLVRKMHSQDIQIQGANWNFYIHVSLNTPIQYDEGQQYPKGVLPSAPIKPHKSGPHPKKHHQDYRSNRIVTRPKQLQGVRRWRRATRSVLVNISKGAVTQRGLQLGTFVIKAILSRGKGGFNIAREEGWCGRVAHVLGWRRRGRIASFLHELIHTWDSLTVFEELQPR